MIFLNHLARGPLPKLEDVKMSKWQLEAHKRSPRTQEDIEERRRVYGERDERRERRLAAFTLAELEEGFRGLRAFVQMIGREEEVNWDKIVPASRIDTDRRNLCTALFLDCRRPALINITETKMKEAIYQGFSGVAEKLAFEPYEGAWVRMAVLTCVCVPDTRLTRLSLSCVVGRSPASAASASTGWAPTQTTMMSTLTER